MKLFSTLLLCSIFLLHFNLVFSVPEIIVEVLDNLFGREIGKQVVVFGVELSFYPGKVGVVVPSPSACRNDVVPIIVILQL